MATKLAICGRKSLFEESRDDIIRGTIVEESSAPLALGGDKRCLNQR